MSEEMWHVVEVRENGDRRRHEAAVKPRAVELATNAIISSSNRRVECSRCAGDRCRECAMLVMEAIR